MNRDLVAPCRLLEWDSAFFGFRIGKLLPERLTQTDVADALAWCGLEQVRCLYFLAASDCPVTTELAEFHGFQFRDVRVTLNRKLQPAPVSAAAVRVFREDDLPALRAIAAVSHRDSRFYYDPGFPTERCHALYETWIERSCHGYAEAVFVAEHQGEPAGYITCHLAAGDGSIGLVAVAAASRGLGLGPQLVSTAVDYFGQVGCKQVSVVTQGRNYAAQRLYQNCGFRTESVGIWYHRWFESAES